MKIYSGIKNFMSFMGTLILAVLGISYYNKNRKIEILEQAVKKHKLNEETRDAIEKLKNTDLDDIISEHNKSIKSRE